MARKIPAHRFDDLVRNAIEVFIAHGYRHTQMADIAEAVGVSKGALYVYVESKDALFNLCLRESARTRPLETPAELPVPAPRAGELAAALKDELSRQSTLRSLVKALKQPRAADIRAELDEIFRELYTTMERQCRGIKLLDRCSDHPEIADVWQTIGREAPRNRLADYMESRMRAGQVRHHPEPSLVARIALETLTTWAVHIRWDRNPQAFDPDVAREGAIDFVIRGLLDDESPRLCAS